MLRADGGTYPPPMAMTRSTTKMTTMRTTSAVTASRSDFTGIRRAQRSSEPVGTSTASRSQSSSCHHRGQSRDFVAGIRRG